MRFYSLKCTEFGQSILGKIAKIVANRKCQKMHQIRFRLGLYPDPTGERSSGPTSWIQVHTSKVRGEERGVQGRKGAGPD